jgi:uncharacterized membrane-anchored protein
MKLRAGSIALIALFMVQAGVALSMVVRYERTLRNGTPFRVKVEPVDPEDPFQGRYVRLTTRLPAPAAIGMSGGGPIYTDGPLYAVLETGADGFARVVSLSYSPPDTGDYVEVRPSAWWPAPAEPARDTPPEPAQPPIANPVFVSLYCDRYYVTEAEAPAIEARYREAMRAPGGSKAWIGIRVRDGMAVIESLSTEP